MKTTILLAALFFSPGLAQAQGGKIPILLDTDIGSDVDDAFALALALASPEVEVLGVTTVGKQADDRAWIVCRFLGHGGFAPIPVAYGRGTQPDFPVDWQIQYRRHPAPIFSRTQKPEKDGAVEFLARVLKEHEARRDKESNLRGITVVAVGPLTNIAQLLEKYPQAEKQIGRLVIMGGSIRKGYGGKDKPEPEWNIKSDVAAAKRVLRSGIRTTVIPLDASATLALGKKDRDRLFAAHTLLTLQVQTLYELWDQETPVLFDPAAVAAVFTDRFFKMEGLRLEVDDNGMTRELEGKPNARVATAVKEKEFIDWYVERVSQVGKASLPPPPKNLSKLIDQGAFPAKVHVAEDYNTDIEKRWWMTGKAETKDLPPGGVRGQRGVLTQDFDDRQGAMKTSYRAVVFNPVPGPPMGKNTRLSFRYKLTGTDVMRVQLYSLTNGYHRYLSLDGLPQGKWAHGTVDMTQMRRPDGMGGPLAEHERIDDIQFYVDPRAELLIDDVILYEAAVDGEKRPFPKHIVYTAWFDTGKQGKEWPGDFEIVPHEKPRAWKTAKSVAGPDGKPWIRVSLKGERGLGEVAELFFRYHLSGAKAVDVEFALKGKTLRKSSVNLQEGAWSETTARLAVPGDAKTRAVDEIRFLLPQGATLLVDDVLLYEPAD